MPNEHSAAGPDPGPVLRIVAGHPTDEEVAALTAALAVKLAASARARATAAARRPARSAWAARDQQLRKPLTPGPGAWRRSGRPG